jgi:hypothetical protein
MENALVVQNKNPAKLFVYPYRLGIFCFEVMKTVMIISIQKAVILFVDYTGSTMFHSV